VMEMCIDNPREGFVDLFATHPSVDARVRALVKFAGGHDSGRIARVEDMETDLSDRQDDAATDDQAPPAAGQEPQPQPKARPGGRTEARHSVRPQKPLRPGRDSAITPRARLP